MNERILVVEDSLFFSSLLKKEIEAKLKFDVTVAQSYAEAMELIDGNREAWFVAILDLNLPDAPDGEIVDSVSERDIPSIVFTGDFRTEVRDRVLSNNVIDYVIKGVQYSVDHVVSLINRIARNRSIKVMVVDDSNANRAFVSRLLKTHKYHVLEAVDGVEAIEVFEKNPEIKLIVTDYNMPNMDGFELTKTVRAKRPGKGGLAIIGMSAADNSILSAKFSKPCRMSI